MKPFSLSAFLLFFGIFWFADIHSVHAANYFKWNADSTTYQINGSNVTGALHSSESTLDCSIKHSGTCSMRMAIIGNDGRNNGQGFEVDQLTYPFNIVGGPSIYYRWWMRISSGFSWGTDNASTKGSRVFGASPYPRGYTGGLHADSIYISECDDVGTPAGGGCGTTNDAANVSYNFRTKNDNQWHEYIVRVKPNSTVGASDAELQLFVDGVSVGQQNGWRLNTYSGNAMIEAWGGWMVFPYWQLNGTASDGGIIHIDDVSTDNVFNSIYSGGDTTSPTWPTGTTFSANATSSSSITVSWSAATDNVGVTGYTVQRCTGLPAACPDASFATVGTPTASPFVDPPTGGTGLSPNTDYSYRVRANDGASPPNYSGWTNVVSAKTQAGTPAPTFTLSANPTSITSGQSSTLTWSAVTNATSCTASGGTFTGSKSTSGGTQSVSPTSTTTYTLSCTGAGGTTNQSATVTVGTVAGSECPSNWKTAHPTWIWCDDFETDKSSLHVDHNGWGTSLVRSSGNGYNSTTSLRSTFPAAPGSVSNGGDFTVSFGASPVTPKIDPADNTKYQELYWRAFIKTQPGWQPGTGMKFTRATSFTASDWSQAMITHWWGGGSPENFLSVDPASGVCRGGVYPAGSPSCTNNTVITSGWNDFNGLYWLGLNTGTNNIFGSASANTWRCVEGYVKLNTPGNSNGVQTLWIDGTQDANRTGLNFMGTYSTYGINIFRLENYMNQGISQSEYRDWDNLVLSTTRVGCSVSDGGDTQPPTSPTNLSASAASSSSINLTWTASTDNVVVTGYQVERCQGSGCSTFTQVSTPTSSPFVDSGLTANTFYNYHVRAADAAGNLSGWSNVVGATTQSGTPTSVAFIQSAASTDTTTAVFPGNNTAGNTIVAAISWGNNATPTCSDSQGNTYTVATNTYDATNNQSLGVCYATNIKAGANTFTLNVGGASSTRILIHEYSGIASSSPVDVTKTNIADATTAANNVTSTAATTTANNDLIFGAVMDDVGTTSITAGTNFTQRQSVNNKDLASQDMMQSTAGSIASTQTFGTAHRYLAHMVAFKTVQQAPTFSVCNTVTTTNFSQSAYNSYGAPYDLFSSNAQLVDAKCTSADTHTIATTIGKVGDTTRIVYTRGYYYDPGINNWTQYTGTCTGTLNGDWCAGPVTATITDADISTASAGAPAYFVGMTCSVQGGSWKCGCRDTSCMNFSWQIQGAGM